MYTGRDDTALYLHSMNNSIQMYEQTDGHTDRYKMV